MGWKVEIVGMCDEKMRQGWRGGVNNGCNCKIMNSLNELNKIM